jgi:RNA polymerase sigma-70 factor, ECF subfamily
MMDPISSPQSIDMGGQATNNEASDPVKFSLVYRAEFGFVVNSLRRLGVPGHDIEDLTHDVFVTAYRKRGSYDPARPIRPWLFGIALRLASDFRHLVRHSRERPIETAAETSDDARSPEESAALAQDRRLVLEAMACIPLDRRAVFIMHDIEGTAIPEIAAALEIPDGTAYSRLRQARIEFSEAVRTLRKEPGGDP